MDSEKWLKAMKFEMDFTSSNQVWTLVDPPKGVKPIGYKWVYKRRFGADGEVITFKAKTCGKRWYLKHFLPRPGLEPMDSPLIEPLQILSPRVGSRPQVLLVSPMAAKAPVTTRGKPRPRRDFKMCNTEYWESR
ncbi:UNVERIFIED_CONTAM: hypothetical protein Scaly_2833900 [Sesamum calycinum]|uniref:Reverse transcriptase Ty1/copia-type domain-containing protein n=1 Tax=Sesamum calycinum TaxID=2727403 RepID=A0AAW2IT48_9LAMI